MRRHIVALIGCAALLAGSARAQDVTRAWDSVKPPPPPPVRAVTIDPAHTAFFALDFNELNCKPDARARCAVAIPHVKKLLDAARAHDMPVVITYTHHMTPKDIKKEITPRPGETVYQGEEDKLYGNQVAADLKAKGIDTILLTGTSTNGAVLFTAVGAALRGFKLVVPVDAVPAPDAYAEQFSLWELVNAPIFRNGHVTTLTRTDMVSFQ